MNDQDACLRADEIRMPLDFTWGRWFLTVPDENPFVRWHWSYDEDAAHEKWEAQASQKTREARNKLVDLLMDYYDEQTPEKQKWIDDNFARTRLRDKRRAVLDPRFNRS